MKKSVVNFLGGVLGIFLASWTIMLVLGAEGLSKFSYWNVFGYLYIIATVVKLVRKADSDDDL